MFGLGRRKAPTLGLDINSDSVTVVQLEKTKTAVQLARFSSLPTPPNTVREGLISDPETVGSVIREVIELSGMKAPPPNTLANVVIPGQSVVIRLMPVPTGMPEDELADVVAQEAINHVPFPIRESNLDWAVMTATERTDPDGVRRVDVIIAAVQKSIVDAYWRMAEAAGIVLGRIDISSLAAIRSLSFAGYLGAVDRLSMVVNIRHDATDINLVRNGVPLFSRSVLLGVETLGEAVARSLDIHLDESLGLLPQIQLFGTAPADPRVAQAAQIARTVYGDITDEVGRSLEFYRSQVGDVSIDEIILVGAGCVAPQVDQFISNRLNIQAAVADPLRDIAFDPVLVREDRRAAQVMALGAVIEPAWLPVATVSLDLNKEGPSAEVLEGAEERRTVRVVPEVETPWFYPALGVGMALLVIVGALWLFFAQYDVPKTQSELDRIQAQIDLDKRKLKNLDTLRDDIKSSERKKALLSTIVKEGRPWSAILDIVRQATPAGVQVRKVVLAGSNLTVEGSAVDFAKISHLAINLGGSPMLSDASVVLAKRDVSTDPRVVAFTVTGRIRATTGPAEKIAARPQVLDFYADWCPPCQRMKPVMDEARRQYGERVEFVVLNTDDPGNYPLMEKYQVKSVPTLCFLDRKGELVTRIVGFDGAEPIMAALEKVTQVASSGETK